MGQHCNVHFLSENRMKNDHSCGIRMSAQVSFVHVLSQCMRLTDIKPNNQSINALLFN